MNPRGAEWVEGMRGVAVGDVAGALGIVEIGRTPSDWCLGPCPACSAEKRHTKSRDRRGALNVPKRAPTSWICQQCDAKGDALDLVAFAVGGAKLRDLADHRKAEVREWCSRFLRIEPGTPNAPRPRPMVTAPVEPPAYPPADELAALWAACVPVTLDVDVAAWLASRSIEALAVGAADLARALPRDVAPLRWMYHRPDPDADGTTWPASSHRALVPLYDAAGAMRSVLARAIAPSPRKSTAPSGYGRTGLLMANGPARAMLEGTARPSIVIVCEGEGDYLQTAVGPGAGARWPGEPPAVLGMFMGGWSDAAAMRVPDGASVVIATDADPDGEKYAARIVASLEARARVGRVKLERWRPRT